MMALVVANLALDGYEIDQAADGGRLIIELVRGARCRQMAVDVIVSDLRMPVCSGLEILRTLRRGGWQVPFVLMTAFPDPTTYIEAARFGARVLEKPFGMNDLRRVVADILGEASL